MEYSIEISGLHKKYGGRRDAGTNALNGVDIKIVKGDYVAVCGVSGTGKTTLLNLIAGLDVPTSGEIRVDGIDMNSLSEAGKARIRNEKIGFVMQDFGLIPYRTVYENIAVPLYFSRKKIDHKQSIKKVLDATGIRGLSSKKVCKLSGGEKQRVAIARALVNDPDIILADEPTGALDSATKQEIMELFGKINGSGKTIVVVTHDKELAGSAKRILTMRDGMLK